jgi:hypothetical protein
LPLSYPVFRSFLQAGFECSCHRNRAGMRLNLLESSLHYRFATRDFLRVKEFGMETIRTALSWPFIEEVPGRYNFDSAARLLDAACEAGVQLVFDILHFGWPDHVNVFSSDFPCRFAQFTHAFVQFLQSRDIREGAVAPVNEISYLSWAGADKAAISPHCIGRGHEFKENLIRAEIASVQVLHSELPRMRLIAPEPAIHIVGDPDIPGDVDEAVAYTLAQFESWDMLTGRLHPELGGKPEYLDLIGVNFYERNEWVHNSTWIHHTDPRYRHLHQILQDIWQRYARPLFISETGTEDERRADWFDYVCNEVELARASGVPVLGVCLYPVLNHEGWDDRRHCHNGLFDYADENGHRETYQPLADAVRRAQRRFSKLSEDNIDDTTVSRPDLLRPSAVGVRLPAPAASDESLCSKS